MAESVEVQLARLQEQMRVMIEGMAEAKHSRNMTRDRLATMNDTIVTLDRRLENVEKQFASSAPTIEEFITIKHQVKGAGIAGKWLWAIGGFIIATVFSFREAIRNWLMN